MVLHPFFASFYKAELCSTRLRLQCAPAAHHAKDSDIQHFKVLQQNVEQAESQLEFCVDALSLLTLRAGKSEQLMASMQVLTTHTFLGDCADCTHRHGVIPEKLADDLQASCLQTELAKLQQEQQQLRMEQPLPVERVKTLEDSIAELSAATEKQSYQLSDAQKVSVHWASLSYLLLSFAAADTSLRPQCCN